MKDNFDFDRFFKENQNILLKIVNSYLFDIEEAKDIVIETMYLIYKKWERVKNMENSLGYAIRIGVNKAKRFLMRRKIFFSDVKEDLKSDFELEEHNINKELFAWLIGEISKLNDKEKSIVLLRDSENFKFEEIAKELGLNISTVKSLYRRAKLKILKKWEEENEKFKM